MIIYSLPVEGSRGLFNGASMATSRAVLMTIGQVSKVDWFDIDRSHVFFSGKRPLS